MKLEKDATIYLIEWKSQEEFENFNTYCKLINLQSNYWEIEYKRRRNNLKTLYSGVFHIEPNVSEKGRRGLIQALLEFKSLQNEINI